MEMFIFALGFRFHCSHIKHFSNMSYYIWFYTILDLDHIGLMSYMSHISHIKIHTWSNINLLQMVVVHLIALFLFIV